MIEIVIREDAIGVAYIHYVPEQHHNGNELLIGSVSRYRMTEGPRQVIALELLSHWSMTMSERDLMLDELCEGMPDPQLARKFFEEFSDDQLAAHVRENRATQRRIAEAGSRWPVLWND